MEHNIIFDEDPWAYNPDMHSVNMMNFAIMNWFGAEFRSRFTSVNIQLNNVYCSNEIKNHEHGLLKPAGQINRQLIMGVEAQWSSKCT